MRTVLAAAFTALFALSLAGAASACPMSGHGDMTEKPKPSTTS